MVSIIITFINEYDFLAEAIQSALAQTPGPYELIVVCNASRIPENPPIPFRESISQFVHEPIQGSAFARNAGLHHAKGDWIQYLDVDDLIMPQKIEHQLQEGNAGDVIVSPLLFKRLNGSIQPSKWLPDDIWTGILNSGLGSTSSMLFKRETLVKLGGWSGSFQSHQEYELLFRLAASGYKIMPVARQETIVRERKKGSITLNSRPVRALEGIVLREKIWEYLIQQGFDNPERKDAFLQYLFRQLRGLYKLDRAKAIEIYHRYFLNVKFNPAAVKLPFYALFYRGLGFDKTERFYSLYSHFRDKYLPILPKNH